jgi:carbon monoxide dehydrogenase subunit G
MELQHHFTVPAPVQTTWDAFTDLERFAPCFPGADLGWVEGDDFGGTVKVKFGPITMNYAGSAHFAEWDPDGKRAVVEARGKDKRGNGTATATVTAALSGDDHETAVEVSTDLAVTGRPAQFGRGVMQDISDKLLEQFVVCVRSKFEPMPAAEPARPAEEKSAAAPAAVPTSEPAPPQAGAAQPAPAELDAFRTALPVFARRFGPAAAGIVAAVTTAVIVLIRRRGRRRRSRHRGRIRR